jgi:hypothetical protein
MKFVDKQGKLHETYVATMISNGKSKIKDIFHIMSDFVSSKFIGCKEAEEISMDDDWRDYDPSVDDNEEDIIKINDGIDNHLSPNNVVEITPINRDEIFIPGVTDKIKRTKNQSVKIDYINHRIMLLDENNNVLHVSNIDHRLEDMSVKDLINLFYEVEESTEDEDDK